MVYLKLDLIDPNPYQTRQRINEAHVHDLAADIASKYESRPETLGLLQVPAGRLVYGDGRVYERIKLLSGSIIVLAKNEGLHLQLAYGHNRLAAFKLLATEGVNKWPVMPEYDLMPVELVTWNDEEMATAAWSENAQRDDLSPIEEALAIQRLMEQFTWTQETVGKRLGLSRSAVANKLRLLKLPEDIQTLILEGDLSERQAMAAMPAFALPQETMEAMSERWETNRLMQSINNSESSDEIRQYANIVVRCATRDIDEKTFKVDAEINGEGIRAAVCNDCDLKLKGNKCGMPKCYDAKQTEWQLMPVRKIAETLNLPAVTYHYSYHTFTWSEYSLAQIQDIIARGCEHLAVAPREYNASAIGPVENKDVIFVCTRKGHKCTCIKSKREQHKRDTHRELGQIKNTAIQQLAGALEKGQAWKAILYKLDWNAQKKPLPNNTHEVCQKIASKLIEQSLYFHDGIATEAAQINSEVWLAARLDGGDALELIERKWTEIQTQLEQTGNDHDRLQSVSAQLGELYRLLDYGHWNGQNDKANEMRHAIAARRKEVIAMMGEKEDDYDY